MWRMDLEDSVPAGCWIKELDLGRLWLFVACCGLAWQDSGLLDSVQDAPF